MNRPVAVYTDIIEIDPRPGVELLEGAGFEVRILGSSDAEDIARVAADADALLIGYSPLNRALLERLKRLRIIATQSAGIDTVDIEAATERGIWVANVPAAATEEVATHAFAMTLSLLRGLPFLDRSVRAGAWDGTGESLRRLSDVTVGVIGLGRIGSRFAELLDPVVGRVVGFDPFAAGSGGVEKMSLDEVLEVSDVVSLHVPLTDETISLLDGSRLGQLPKGAFVVNVSRGGLIDHGALLDLIDAGHLGGAALDVLPNEPPTSGDRVVGHPRVLITPHAAYLSDRAARDYVLHQARNVIGWHRDGAPECAVNAPNQVTTVS